MQGVVGFLITTKIWQNDGHEFGGLVFGPPCRCPRQVSQFYQLQFIIKHVEKLFRLFIPLAIVGPTS